MPLRNIIIYSLSLAIEFKSIMGAFINILDWEGLKVVYLEFTIGSKYILTVYTVC